MVPYYFRGIQFHWQNTQNELKSGSVFGSRAGIVTSLVQRETLVQSTHEVDNCLERASEQRVEAEEEEEAVAAADGGLLLLLLLGDRGNEFTVCHCRAARRPSPALTRMYSK